MLRFLWLIPGSIRDRKRAAQKERDYVRLCFERLWTYVQDRASKDARGALDAFMLLQPGAQSSVTDDLNGAFFTWWYERHGVKSLLVQRELGSVERSQMWRVRIYNRVPPMWRLRYQKCFVIPFLSDDGGSRAYRERWRMREIAHRTMKGLRRRAR